LNLKRNFKGFGDSLINFLYSLAKSRTTDMWTGEKVSNSALSQALLTSDLEKPGGLDRHEKGDYVEGYIAEAWISGVITTDEATKVLMKSLKKYDLEDEEEEAVVEAFRNLLNYIRGKL
jgi:hypothetical protein